MVPRIKLTYMFLLKYDVGQDHPKVIPKDHIHNAELINAQIMNNYARAQLKCRQYYFDAEDIIRFMKYYKPSTL